MKYRFVVLFLLFSLLTRVVKAADHLRLNPHLDYSSDSHDGPLITGDHLQDGIVAGRPNYVIIYGEGCFNSKRQARRTVELYTKYRGRVNFVVIDLDTPLKAAQQELVSRFYRGYIPHVVVLDTPGNPVYNSSGEAQVAIISAILDRLLK
ncbi:MAG: hypothetical protein ACM3PW_00830 [Chlamydiota bacterium]